MFFQTLQYPFVGMLFQCPTNVFANGQQQFRNHMPVNATQTFVLVKSARAASKRLMIEYLFVNILKCLNVRFVYIINNLFLKLL
jgi:hypothetical protein